MRRPNRRPNYLKAEDITNWQETADYIIYKDGVYTVALNGNTGVEESRNTDSATVIQYALDNATGKVYVKDGTYTITAPIVPSAYSYLVGSGQGATILFCQAATAINVIYWTGVDNVTIRDLTIDGNTANQASGGTSANQCGILFTDSERCLIHNVEVKNARYYGIHLYGDNKHNHIIACKVHNNRLYGINMYDDTEYTIISHCDVYSNKHNINGHQRIEGTRIIANNIYGAETNNIYLEDSSGIFIVSNNISEGPYGIKLGASAKLITNSLIADNYIYQCTTGKIFLVWTNYITVTGNIIFQDNNNTYGIRVDLDSDHNIIKNNIFINHATAIDLNGDYNTVKDNQIVAATTPYDNAGAGNLCGYNDGYVGDAKGVTGAVADGGTFAHGLGTTPVGCVVIGTIAGDIISISALGAANVTMNIKNEGGGAGTAQVLYWHAWI